MKVLITGGSGSIGSKIARRLFDAGYEVIIHDIDETKLYFLLRDEYNYKVGIYTADIKDRDAVDDCMSQGIDAVIHAAAYKHVPTGEYHPDQMVKTNVLGALNVFRSAIKYGVKKVVVVSTDKAAYPTGVMGASKLIQERIALNFNNKHDTKFNIVRFGNVVMSRGSVVERFSEFAKEKKRLQLMDPNMTRFWMGFDDAVDLVLYALNDKDSGCVYSMITKGWKLIDLAKAFGYTESEWDVLGRRKGEKIHEVLITEEEVDRSEIVDKNIIKVWPEAKKGKTPMGLKNEVKSNNSLMSVEEIKKKLVKARMI